MEAQSEASNQRMKTLADAMMQSSSQIALAFARKQPDQQVNSAANKIAAEFPKVCADLREWLVFA